MESKLIKFAPVIIDRIYNCNKCQGTGDVSLSTLSRRKPKKPGERCPDCKGLGIFYRDDPNHHNISFDQTEVEMVVKAVERIRRMLRERNGRECARYVLDFADNQMAPLEHRVHKLVVHDLFEACIMSDIIRSQWGQIPHLWRAELIKLMNQWAFDEVDAPFWMACVPDSEG